MLEMENTSTIHIRVNSTVMIDMIYRLVILVAKEERGMALDTTPITIGMCTDGLTAVGQFMTI